MARSCDLFLSHSGAQGNFVRRLYHELVHVNHDPFFDKDPQSRSIPKGSDFPSVIFDACRSCKLFVAVLSEEYMVSMWPMLELQQFFCHNPLALNNPEPNVFPIFYKLQPGDLRNPENLERWKRSWEEQVPSWHKNNRDWYSEGSSNFTALTLVMDRWSQAIQMLSHHSGHVIEKDEDAFIQAIVSNICGSLPPRLSFMMGDHFKGAELIQAEIDEQFRKQQHGDHNVDEDSLRRPLAVGLYGVGGSGKTTVCNYMLQFYNRQAEYIGNCCFIKFPTKKDDTSLLTQSLKDVLSKRGNLNETALKRIQSVEEAMPHIKTMLSSYKVFLIIDNVWDWSLVIANNIFRMEFMPGSRLLVTARSKDWLQRLSSNSSNLMLEGRRNLLAMQILHVPSISEEEAIEALKAYSLGSLQELSNIDGHLRSLAKLCFFSRQCHPLLLETVGKRLRSQGRQLSSAEDWARFYSRLEASVRGSGEVEDQIANVLRTSYDALQPGLQNTFLKLGTCVPKEFYRYLPSLTEWLSKVSDGGFHTAEDIRFQLFELKYYGLIEIHQQADVVIHDILIMLIDNLVQEREGKPKCFFREGGMSSLSVKEFLKLKYIYESFAPDKLCFDISGSQTMSRPALEVFHVEAFVTTPARCIDRLSVKHMHVLRHLCLCNLAGLSEVGGWHGAPNLVSVEIRDCRSIKKIESMTCLHRLESLDLWGLSKCNLTHVLKDSRKVRRLALVEETLSTLTSLQTLALMKNSGTVRVSTFDSASSRVLDPSNSKRRELILNLQKLVRLRELKLDLCEKLREVKLADAALTNLEFLRFSSETSCFFSTSTRRSPLPMDAFTNLRVLELNGGMISGHDAMDVGSIELPASLEDLTIWGFRRARQFTYSSALVNLTKLHVGECASLESITGLGGYFKLSELRIWECESLREVGHWESPFNRYSLGLVYICNCPSLETLSNIANLPSLTRLTTAGLVGPGCVQSSWEAEDALSRMGITTTEEIHFTTNLPFLRHVPEHSTRRQVGAGSDQGGSLFEGLKEHFNQHEGGTSITWLRK